MGTVETGEEAGSGTVTTVGGSHDGGAHGGVLTRRTGEQGAPPDPKPNSTAGGAVPVIVAVCRRVWVEMWPKDGRGGSRRHRSARRRKGRRRRISDRD